MVKKGLILITIIISVFFFSFPISKFVFSDPVDCTETPTDPSCQVDCSTDPTQEGCDVCPGLPGTQTDPSECVDCTVESPPASCDVCPSLPGTQTDPSECVDCTVDDPPALCDVCPNVEGVQINPFDCDVCVDQPGVQTDPLECDYCPDIPGVQNDPAACYQCVPEESPDQCHIEYCADSEANNTSDAPACEAANQDAVQNHGYSCYGVFSDPPCAYDPVIYCPPTTQDDCEEAHPKNECILGSNCPSLCSWNTLIQITCPSGAKYFAPASGSYFPVPPNTCHPPTVFSQEYIDALTTAYCSALVPPDVPCTGPDCEEYDWCPLVPGTQTDPADCEEVDYCLDMPGTQTDPSECTDFCKNIDGVQYESSVYSLDENGDCLCYGVECGPDMCPNIPSIQLEVPEGYEVDTGGDCVCIGEFCCSNGTSFCADSNQCILDTDVCTDDKCNNIEGIQIEIPSGYISNNIGGCICNNESCTASDMCKNITGIQTTVPFGYEQDAEGNCNCTGNDCGEDKCINIEGIQLSVPPGYSSADSICTCVNSSCLVCTGGVCTSDKCPNITGTQAEVPFGYTINGEGQCVCSGVGCAPDMCPNISGIQMSIPLGYIVENDSCVCNDTSCQTINGFCGYLSGRVVSSSQGITGTNACSSGSRSDVVLDGSVYKWSCLGSNSGTDALNCSASLGCSNPLQYYCDQTNSCLYYDQTLNNGVVCNQVIEPPGKNLLLDGTQGTVLLQNTLKTTTLIKPEESCVVSWGRGTGVLERYNNETHCALFNQDMKIATFDPETVGSTTSVTTLTGNLSATPTSLTEDNIKKDMIYTLKCWQGAQTDSTVYKQAVGSCRLNVRSTEYN